MSDLYEGVPDLVDRFAARDALQQLMDRLCAAGYSDEQAPVKVATLARQLLRAWGVSVAISERMLLEPSPEGCISSLEALELRRAWCVDADDPDLDWRGVS